MKRTLTILFLLLISFNSFCADTHNLMSYPSLYSVEQTSQRLTEILKNKGFTIFSQIDHAKGAKNAGIQLADTKLIIFGNPKIGSRLMLCQPTIAIDLPQKALIWQDANKKVWLSVNSPEYLKKRHQVKGCDAIFSKIKKALNAISTKATQ